MVDLGTGTGRLPLLLAGRVRCVVGLDLYRDMLREHVRQRAQAGGAWPLLQGDMRALPLADACADLVTAGWAIGHWRAWRPADWRAQITLILREMLRLAAPGGRLVICETLGTGSLAPAAPAAGLAEYYAWLEDTWGFRREVIRTDYQFESVGAAAAQAEFFFGPELAEKIRAHGWARLPEWTGVWHRPASPEAAPASGAAR